MFRFALKDYAKRLTLSLFVSLFFVVVICMSALYAPWIIGEFVQSYKVDSNMTESTANKTSLEYMTYVSMCHHEGEGPSIYHDSEKVKLALTELISMDKTGVILGYDEESKFQPVIERATYIVLLGDVSPALPGLKLVYKTLDTPIASIQSKMDKPEGTIRFEDRDVTVVSTHNKVELRTITNKRVKLEDVSDKTFIRMTPATFFEQNPHQLYNCLLNIVVPPQNMSTPALYAKQNELIYQINEQCKWGHMERSYEKSIVQVKERGTSDNLLLGGMVLATIAISMITAIACIVFLIQQNERTYSVHRLYGATPFQVKMRVAAYFALLMLPSMLISFFYATVFQAPYHSFSFLPYLWLCCLFVGLGCACLPLPFYNLKKQSIELVLRSND